MITDDSQINYNGMQNQFRWVEKINMKDAVRIGLVESEIIFEYMHPEDGGETHKYISFRKMQKLNTELYLFLEGNNVDVDDPKDDQYILCIGSNDYEALVEFKLIWL